MHSIYRANTQLSQLLAKCNLFRAHFGLSSVNVYFFCSSLLVWHPSACCCRHSMAFSNGNFGKQDWKSDCIEISWIEWQRIAQMCIKCVMIWCVCMCFSIIRSVVYAFNCFNKLNSRLKTNVNNVSFVTHFMCATIHNTHVKTHVHVHICLVENKLLFASVYNHLEKWIERPVAIANASAKRK